MKKTFLLLSALLLTTGTLFAQSAEELLRRYCDSVGAYRVIPAETTTKVETKMRVNGIETLATYITAPPFKARMEMSVMGQSATIIINESQGWAIEGKQVTEIPISELAALREQGVVESLHWKPELYNLTLLEPRGKKEAQFDIIEMTPKQPFHPYKKIVLYLDKTTALPDHAVITAAAPNESMVTTMQFKSFAESDGIKYPAQTIMRAGDMSAVIEISDFIADYPVTEEMFAKPE